MRILAIALAAAALAGCAGDPRPTTGSAFEQMLRAERKQLAAIIDYGEFVAVCTRALLLDHQEFLAAHGVAVHGSGGGRYLEGSELLAACGEQCSPDSGFGQILAEFLIDR